MQILDAAEQARAQGWEYDLDAAYVEVYNEGLRDLLAEGGKGARDAGRIADQNAVKHAPAGAPPSSSAPSPMLSASLSDALCSACCGTRW